MIPELSVVIPIFNEAQNLEPLHDELTRVLGGWGRPYEVIFVDDGSTDESFPILKRLHARDPQTRVIQFRKNFGQTAAFAAGIAAARGALIVTSDGDMQNDPADIPAMVADLETGRGGEGFDIVCGWRKVRHDTFLTRRLPSMLANRLISKATGVVLHDYGCSLKVFRAEVIKPLRLYGEMHRFLPALASEMGVHIQERVVNHRPRKFGQSKYGLSRTFRVILDLITVKFLLSYSTRPLRVFGVAGGFLGLAGAGVLGVLSFQKLILGWSNLGQWKFWLGILLVFTGFQLLTLGLLAELQARTYQESRNKPVYSIRQELG